MSMSPNVVAGGVSSAFKGVNPGLIAAVVATGLAYLLAA
jgi:hypothetical protein